MLENTRSLGEAACKVDPEEQLQHARRVREKTEVDIKAFESLGEYYYPGSEKNTLMLYGAMHQALRNAKNQERRWLDEIDKE